MSNGNEQLEIIDQIYAAAIEPERFDELVDIWHEKLISSGADGLKRYPGELERLYVHLDQADTILSLVSENSSGLPTPLFAKINSEPRPTLVVDAHGKIHATNDAAQKHFDLKAGESVSDWISDSAKRREIMRTIARLGSEKTKPVDETPELVRVWTEEDSRQILLSLVAWATASGRRFVFVQSSNFYWPQHLSPVIANAFDLSSAETDVVKLIVEGASVQDVANTRGSSVATVRSQIKSIYAKTETKNQSEFLRMTLGLATLNLRDRDTITGAFVKPETTRQKAWPLPEHERLFSLRHGRLLDYADCGPVDGIPCFYFHNDFLGNIWPHDAATAAVGAGFRMIIPARPYYGRSTPYPDGVVNYEQTTDDMIALMEHLGVARALLVSISSGGMFAGALIDAHPERCIGHVALAPAFAVESAEEEAKMPKMYRFMNSVVKRHPRLLETFLKLGMAYHNRVGSVRYLHRILGDVPADLAVINDESNLDAIVRGLEFCGTHGHLGIFNDYKTILSDSNEAFMRTPFPTFTVIGTDDRNSRLLRTNRMIDAGGNIRKVMADHGGTLILYTHGDLVVQTMRDACDWDAQSGRA